MIMPSSVSRKPAKSGTRSAAEITLSDWPELEKRRGTNYREAMHFAASILPNDRRRKIVLLSDGNDTSGEAEASVLDLVRMGIEFDAMALQNPDSPEVLVESVQTPRNIAPNEHFDLTTDHPIYD